MKRITVRIDSDDMEELIREHLTALFPQMEIADFHIPYLSDININLSRKVDEGSWIESPPALEPPVALSPAETDEMPF